ncbi:MAG: DUF423 domain-containing protein [Acidobacteria bacterium]|nr:MAG: DUF423 domain-containing protein [Acidobacteriota bacterium]
MKLLGILGSVGLLLGVMLGAFAAHGLRGHLSEQMQIVFETGVRYQMYHSFAVLIAAVLVQRNQNFFLAGIFYAIGIALFSFSLYILALTGIRWLGAITPLGGLSFMIGHALLLIGFLRTDGNKKT